MKRVVLVSLCLLMSFSGALFASGAQEESAKPEGPAKITVWDIYPEGAPFRKVLDGAIARFKTANPGSEVTVVSYGDMSNYKTKFATMIAAGGKDVDVFQTWGGGQLATYARRGFCARPQRGDEEGQLAGQVLLRGSDLRVRRREGLGRPRRARERDVLLQQGDLREVRYQCSGYL
jgi:hypothetical protein